MGPVPQNCEIETYMTPGEAEGKGSILRFKPQRSLPRRIAGAQLKTSIAPSGLQTNFFLRTPGFTRGHQGVASSRPIVTLLNLNQMTQKATIPINQIESWFSLPDPKDRNVYDPR